MSDDRDVQPSGILSTHRALSASAVAALIERFERGDVHRTQLLDADGMVVQRVRVDDVRGGTWGARLLPRRPRWAHRVHAWLLGYFWLPCPLCYRNFGGHEVGGALYPNYGSGGTSICLDCARTHTDSEG